MRTLSLALVFALVSAIAFASPALRLRKTVCQPDGSLLTIVKCGDEYRSFFATTDGYVVVKGSNGYCYVSALDVSGSGDSGVWAHNEDERGLSEELWLNANGTTSENFMAFAASSRAAIETRALGTSDNPQGEVTYPVILVNFSDVSFSITNAVDTFNRQFNEKGFSGGGAAGSVRDYFVAQSRGKYSPSFDVVCEVTLSKSRAYYGARVGDSNDSHVSEMVREAVNLAEKQGVNFSKYKTAAGGVPIVGVVFAGVGENSSWEDDAVWASYYTAITNFTGGKINSFLVVNELLPTIRRTDAQVDTLYNIEGIGTFCHEFSHFLGLPDFYNTYDSSSLVGMSWWSIMDYGQYWKNGTVPMGYSAYEKNFMGWLDIDTLKTEKQMVKINALGSESENAYYIRNDSDATGCEYYILENRQPSAWYPERLGSGMFVIHVDYNAAAWMGNTVNIVKNHRRMSYVPADNDIKPENESAPKDYQGDLFPGLTGNKVLRDNGVPGFQQYKGAGMGKFLTGISEDNGIVSFLYMAEGTLAKPENLKVIPNSDVTSLTAQWDAVENAKAYNVSVWDGDKTLLTRQTENCTLDIGGFESVKNLKVTVGATADDYMDSDMSSIEFENPVGVENIKNAEDAELFDVFTISGIKVAEKVRAEKVEDMPEKGVYILKGKNGVRKIMVR